MRSTKAYHQVKPSTVSIYGWLFNYLLQLLIKGFSSLSIKYLHGGNEIQMVQYPGMILLRVAAKPSSRVLEFHSLRVSKGLLSVHTLTPKVKKFILGIDKKVTVHY